MRAFCLRKKGTFNVIWKVGGALAPLAPPVPTPLEGNFIQMANLVARHNSRVQSWLSDENMTPYAVKYLSTSSQNDILAEDVKSRIIKDVVSDLD